MATGCDTAEQIETVRDVVGVRPVIDNPPRVLAVFNMKGGVGKNHHIRESRDQDCRKGVTGLGP